MAGSPKAITTFKIFLMTSADGTSYTKLLDIKDFPDLGGAPEMLQTTTLSDYMHTYVPGIQSLEALEFTANYNLTDFQAIQALAGIDTQFAVWFGGSGTLANPTPSGEYGQWSFTGQISAFPVGGGVDEVVDMTITIAPSTPIVLTVPTAP